MNKNPNNQQITKDDCTRALSLIKTLHIETSPNEGHSNPNSIEDRWNILKDMVTRMAEQIAPSSSKNVKLLFEQTDMVDSLPFLNDCATT